MTKTYALIIMFLLMSCGANQVATKRNQAWSNYFTIDEQKMMLYDQAEKLFEKGKREQSIQDLVKAREGFRFLAIDYVYDRADKKVKEINKYLLTQKAYYYDLFEQAEQKNLLFTAAGYCKQILRLFPDDKKAAAFLDDNKEAIESRFTKNIEAGYDYLNKNKLNAATRCFNRILVYDPSHKKSIAALKDIQTKKRAIRIASLNKAKRDKLAALSKAKADAKAEQEELELSKKEQENIYILGIKAYEKKDYLKAFQFFEDLKEYTYKDSLLYYKRTEDKINVLGLSENE